MASIFLVWLYIESLKYEKRNFYHGITVLQAVPDGTCVQHWHTWRFSAWFSGNHSGTENTQKH